MRGINKAIIIGTTGKDTEVRYSAGGAAIGQVSVVTSEQWKDKATGEKKEDSQWHTVKFFGRLAEIAGEYLKKGSQVYIEGRLKTDKYTDKAGVERYTTYIVANEMQMLGGKPQSQESKPAPRPQQPPSANAPSNAPFEDDDAPF